VEGTVREVKRRVRVVASSYRAIDRSVTRWIVVTMVDIVMFYLFRVSARDINDVMCGMCNDYSVSK